MKRSERKARFARFVKFVERSDETKVYAELCKAKKGQNEMNTTPATQRELNARRLPQPARQRSGIGVQIIKLFHALSANLRPGLGSQGIV